MKRLKFESEPELAELWDACIHNLLYDKDNYVTDIVNLFDSIGININSRILDTCAGSGFISLYLRKLGYQIDCMDLMQDEIDLFKENAKKLKVDESVSQLSWKEIPKVYSPESYDFLFCRGNSFIYANGG